MRISETFWMTHTHKPISGYSGLTASNTKTCPFSTSHSPRMHTEKIKLASQIVPFINTVKKKETAHLKMLSEQVGFYMMGGK